MGVVLYETYENFLDRNNQEYVGKVLHRTLSERVEGQVMLSHTPEKEKLCFDINGYVDGRWVYVFEVKCRSYPTSWLWRYGWAIAVPRLTKLRQTFYRNGRWLKSVWLALCTMEGDVFIISLSVVARVWPQLNKPPAGWAKDNHGKIDRPDIDGVVIPLKFMLQVNV